MKKLTFLIMMICLSVLFCTSGAFASEAGEVPGRTEDTTGALSVLQTESLDKMCHECISDYNVDLAVISVRPEEYEDRDFYDIALSYYEDNDLGYGESRDCIIFICDAASQKAEYFEFGNAQGLIPERFYEFAAEKSLGYKESNGLFGVMYAGGRFIIRYLEDEAQSEGGAQDGAQAGAKAGEGEAVDEVEGGAKAGEGEAGDGVEGGVQAGEGEAGDEVEGRVQAGEGEAGGEVEGRVQAGEGNGTADLSGAEGFADGAEAGVAGGFVAHHDENAPRVTDRADIFTPEEEAAMEERLRRLRDEICCDLVIFTDVTANGKEHKYCAADFFDYGGYGWGEDYEGACLFICMDPGDRGWWVANNGPRTMRLYTEDIANLMDDELYEYMAAGEYAEGVNDWITNYSTLYTKGYPFAPEWLPEEGEEPERKHDPDAPRIDDAGGALSEAQISELTAAVKDLSERYGLDVVIHTTRYLAEMDIDGYAERYYRCCGYGLGDDYDGIALVVYLAGRGYYRSSAIYASGAGNNNLTDVNRTRLLGFFSDEADYNDNLFGGMKKYLDKLSSMEKSGRVPRSNAYWGFISLTGIILGAIFGSVTLNRAKRKMETPALALNADIYLKEGSLDVKGNDKFLYSSTGMTYSPVSTSSSSGSGSSYSSNRSSSYSSSYRSSSGRTHSGSGRRF